MDQFEILIQGRRYSADTATIRQWILEGRVIKFDQVRQGQLEEWKTADKIPEFADAFSQVLRGGGSPPPPSQGLVAPQPAAYVPPPSGGYVPPPPGPAPEYRPPTAPPGQTIYRPVSPPPFARPRKGANPIKIILGIAAVVAVVAGGIGFAVWKGVKNFKPVNYDQVMMSCSLKGGDSVSFVQLTLPKGWRPTTGLNPEAQVQAVNPSKAAFLIIISDELNQYSEAERRTIKDLPLEQFGEAAVNRMQSMVESADVRERNSIKLGGHPAYQQLIDVKYKGQKMKMSLIIIRGLFGIHQLLLWTPENSFNETVTQFQGIIENFREVNEKNYKFSYRLTEIGEFGEILFLSDNPIDIAKGDGIKDDGEGRGRIETDKSRVFTVNGRKFSVREDGIMQGRNFWPKDTTETKRMIVRLDSLDATPR
jgi:hypothetical protein